MNSFLIFLVLINSLTLPLYAQARKSFDWHIKLHIVTKFAKGVLVTKIEPDVVWPLSYKVDIKRLDDRLDTLKYVITPNNEYTEERPTHVELNLKVDGLKACPVTTLPLKYNFQNAANATNSANFEVLGLPSIKSILPTSKSVDKKILDDIKTFDIVVENSTGKVANIIGLGIARVPSTIELLSIINQGDFSSGVSGFHGIAPVEIKLERQGGKLTGTLQKKNDDHYYTIIKKKYNAASPKGSMFVKFGYSEQIPKDGGKFRLTLVLKNDSEASFSDIYGRLVETSHKVPLPKWVFFFECNDGVYIYKKTE